MAIKFTADEVLRIAEMIEHNGNAFYAAAARVTTDFTNAALFKQLSEWENIHAELFASMRNELTEAERESVVYDPDDELSLYLKTLADSALFTASNPVTFFETQPPVKEMCRMALDIEHESIVFYSGMREYVPVRLGREKVDAIIKEEVRHIAILNKAFGAIT